MPEHLPLEPSPNIETLWRSLCYVRIDTSCILQLLLEDHTVRLTC
jgi:hypothetical protein